MHHPHVSGEVFEATARWLATAGAAGLQSHDLWIVVASQEREWTLTPSCNLFFTVNFRICIETMCTYVYSTESYLTMPAWMRDSLSRVVAVNPPNPHLYLLSPKISCSKVWVPKCLQVGFLGSRSSGNDRWPLVGWYKPRRGAKQLKSDRVKKGFGRIGRISAYISSSIETLTTLITLSPKNMPSKRLWTTHFFSRARQYQMGLS